MHKLNVFYLSALVILSVACCPEVEPEIIPCQTNRVVLVEEFTGLDCAACPTGMIKLEQIAAQNPDKVVVVAEHAGYFAIDYNGFDLKCTDGEALEQYLGPSPSFPSASVNRKMYEGESSLLLDKEKWAGLIGQELCQPPIVELDLVTTYDESSRSMSVVVNINRGKFFNEALKHDLALSIMITEDNIVGYQNTLNGINYNYKHKHVLRDVLSTDFKGDVVIAAGNPITTQQVMAINQYTLPADWNPANCHVIAFIHNKNTNNKEIHQALKADLID